MSFAYCNAMRQFAMTHEHRHRCKDEESRGDGVTVTAQSVTLYCYVLGLSNRGGGGPIIKFFGHGSHVPCPLPMLVAMPTYVLPDKFIPNVHRDVHSKHPKKLHEYLQLHATKRISFCFNTIQYRLPYVYRL